MVQEKLKPAYRFSRFQISNLKDKVMAYENEKLINSICYKTHITKKAAKIAFIELKKFLFICGVTGETLIPSAKLDAIWHAFILFNGDYLGFCQQYFGRSILHRPEINFIRNTGKTDRGEYKFAYEIAKEQFPSLNPDFWPSPDLNIESAADFSVPLDISSLRPAFENRSSGYLEKMVLEKNIFQ